MNQELNNLLLDLEDHQSYVRDAENDIASYFTEYGCNCPDLEQNLEEAQSQVEDIRRQIRELS
jgi:chromosome segregation ATPase